MKRSTLILFAIFGLYLFAIGCDAGVLVNPGVELDMTTLTAEMPNSVMSGGMLEVIFDLRLQEEGDLYTNCRDDSTGDDDDPFALNHESNLYTEIFRETEVDLLLRFEDSTGWSGFNGGPTSCSDVDGDSVCRATVTFEQLGITNCADARSPQGDQDFHMYVRAPGLNGNSEQVTTVQMGVDVSAIDGKTYSLLPAITVEFEETEQYGESVGPITIITPNMAPGTTDFRRSGEGVKDFSIQGGTISNSLYIYSDDHETTLPFVRTDLAKVFLAISFNPNQVEVIDVPYFQDADIGGETASIAFSRLNDVTSTIPNSISDGFNCAIEAEVPEAGHCWHIFEVNANRLGSDNDQEENLLSHISAMIDVSFNMKESGSGTIHYVLGTGTNIPARTDTNTDNFGDVGNTGAQITNGDGNPPVYWIEDSYVMREFSSGTPVSACQDNNLPLEMHLGQQGFFALEFTNPFTETVPWQSDGSISADFAPSSSDWVVEEDEDSLSVSTDSASYAFSLTAPMSSSANRMDYSYNLFMNGDQMPEQCRGTIYLTDKILPGWRIAHDGNGFPGVSQGSIAAQGAGVLLQDAGIVSEPIEVLGPVGASPEYRIEVETTCPSVNIRIANYNTLTDDYTPGPSLETSTEGGKVVATTTIPSGTMRGVMVQSDGGPECSIISVGLFEADSLFAEDADFMYGASVSGAGCCPENFCWSGDSCVESGTLAGPSDGSGTAEPAYGCADGEWVEVISKPSFYNEAIGGCLLESQCYNHDLGSCHESGDYYTSSLGDHYCNNGNWESRTRWVFEQLVSLGKAESPGSFSVACGQPGEVLNELNAACAECVYVFNSVMGCNGADTCANSENVCVLETATGMRAVGTALNNGIGDTFSGGTGSLLYAFGLPVSNDGHYCEGAQANTGESRWQRCNGDDAMYNNVINATIIKVDGTGGAFPPLGLDVLSTDTPETLGMRQAAVSFLPSLPNFLDPPFDDSIDAEFLYNHVNDVSHFNRVYYSEGNGRRVRGFWDVSSNLAVNGGAIGETDLLEEQAAMYVEYTGFDNLCNFIDIPSAADECPFAEEGFGNVCCFQDGSTARILSQGNAHQALGRIGIGNVPRDELVGDALSYFRFFPDLTWKLRIGADQ